MREKGGGGGGVQKCGKQGVILGTKGRFCCCLRKFFGVHFGGQFWDPLVPTEDWKWSCKWGERVGPGGGGGAGGWVRGIFCWCIWSFLGVHSGDVKYISSVSHTLSFLPKKNMIQSAKIPSNPIGLGFASHAHIPPNACLLTAGASRHRPGCITGWVVPGGRHQP